MLAAEAASVLKLKNGNDSGVVVDGSLMEDFVTEIGAGAMDGDSSVVPGISDDKDNDDVPCHQPAGPLLWV